MHPEEVAGGFTCQSGKTENIKKIDRVLFRKYGMIENEKYMQTETFYGRNMGRQTWKREEHVKLYSVISMGHF